MNEKDKLIEELQELLINSGELTTFIEKENYKEYDMDLIQKIMKDNYNTIVEYEDYIAIFYNFLKVNNKREFDDIKEYSNGYVILIGDTILELDCLEDFGDELMGYSCCYESREEAIKCFKEEY